MSFMLPICTARLIQLKLSTKNSIPITYDNIITISYCTLDA